MRAYFHHGICLIDATSFAKQKNLPQQVEKPERKGKIKFKLWQKLIAPPKDFGTRQL